MTIECNQYNMLSCIEYMNVCLCVLTTAAAMLCCLLRLLLRNVRSERLPIHAIVHVWYITLTR